MTNYGKKIKETTTKYGSIWIQKLPIIAGMEYRNGKLLDSKLKEVGSYKHAVYCDKMGSTMYEISCQKEFYTR